MSTEARRAPEGRDPARLAETCRLLEALAGPLLHLDGRGRVTEASAAAAELLGRDAADLRGAHLRDILDQPAALLFPPAEEPAAAGPRVYNFERPVTAKAPDGGRIDLRLSLAGLPGTDGPRYLARLSPGAAPAPAADSDSELRRFLAHLSSFNIKLDLQGRMVMVSSSILARTGFDLQEFVGRHWSEFPWFTHDEAVTARYAAAVERAIALGEESAYEERVRSVHGHDLRIVCRLAPVRDARGRTEYLVAEAFDVTRLKRTEAELRDFREAVAQSADGIAIADMEGILRYANRAWAEMHGWDTESLIGCHLHVCHTERQVREEVEPIVAHIVRTGSFEGEVGHVRRSGETFPTWMTSSLVTDAEGRPRGFIGSAHDITDLKHYQDELRDAKERAEAAVAVKNRFLANMSHELRTPLNSIAGMAELMLDTRLDEEQRRLIDTLRDSTRHLGCLIQDILDHASIETDGYRLAPAPFDLRESVAAALAEAAPQGKGGSVEILCDVDPATPARVEGDALRLRQILSNLLSNAVKFTEAGEIRLAVAPAGGEDGADRLRFSVVDTGIGVSAEDRERIFDSFTQADASRTRSFGGTGLGTTIARQLVELMGGRIWVESPVPHEGPGGPGSAFRFEIPLPPAGGEEPKAAAAARTDGGAATATGCAGHILLGEDNATNRMLTRKLLERRGYRVTEAEDGRRVLDALEGGERFDLLLLDIQMPVMCGFEVVERLRAREAEDGEPRLPVVALTASAMGGDRERCLAAGMDDHVVKPVEVDALYAAIAAQLGESDRA